MPELYAALTDLVPPDAEAAEGLPRLPIAEALLSRAERRPAPADWRRWALALAGVAAPPGDLPVGRTLARHHGVEPGPDSTWFVATPVTLVAGLSRVHFAPGGALRLAPGAAAALAARFAAEWRDPALELVVAGDSLLLRAAGRYQLASFDPAPFAGREAAAAFPTGPDAGRLQRLMTELQMWLHGAAPAVREGGPVNALWLWGGGDAALPPAAAWPALDDGDAFLAAAAGAAAGRAADARLESWSLAAQARAGHAFAALDALRFAPLAAALAARRLDRARVYFDGHEFLLRPGQRWHRWRRPRPWWELGA
jgi:hypothetical protein